MSQLSPVEPLPVTTPNQPCSPLVQGVLSCLDVQLEEEIAHYRRKRPIKQVSQGRATKSNVGKKGLDLISVPATESRMPLPTPPAKEYLAQPLLNNDSAEAEKTPLPPESINEEAAAPGLNGKANIAGEAKPEWETPSLGLRNRVVAKELPNEYLQSSEALLKNLDEDEFVESAASPSNNKLRTPLGIGSLLLLLVGAATLGYVAMNPATISHLAGNKQSDSSKVAAGSATNAGGIPNSPNLAQQEFVELNLKTLSTVNPRGSAVSQVVPGATKTQVPVNPPAPLPNSAAVTSRLDLPSALIPPAIQSGILPPQVAQPPIPKSPPTVVTSPAAKKGVTSQTPAKKPTAAKKAANKFLVIMSYGGDRSLAQARKVAPNALVRQLQQGRAIQLSAFADEKAAQKKVQDLRKQGISARVYRF